MDLLSDPKAIQATKQAYDEAVKALHNEVKLPWPEKYRPKTVSDVILPAKIKNMVEFAIERNEFNNFIFHSGNPGTGKTTTAEAIPKQIGADYKTLYLSERGMEVIDAIRDYSMQKLIDGKPRFIILDEADRPKVQDKKSFYNALQPLIEKSSSTLRFILTCNNLHLIPEAVQSRCAPVSFAHNDDNEVKKVLFARMKEIAIIETGDESKVNIDTLKEIARFHFPDMRAIISSMMNNYLENQGSIDGIPNFQTGDIVGRVWELIETGDDLALSKFVSENVVDYLALYNPFGYHVIHRIDKKFRYQFAILLGEYQYRASQPAVDPWVNANAFFAQIMMMLKNG
jgi:Cdc6-like AAA superfamily ATPase